MKKLLLIGILFAIQAKPVFAQNNQPLVPESNIQLFLNQPGKYIKSYFTGIGKVKEINFQIIKATNLTDSKTAEGVRLSYRNATAVEIQYGFLDIDEINDIEKTIYDLNTNVFNNPPATAPTDNLDYYYCSRSGIKIGGFASFYSGTYGKMTWYQFIKLGDRDQDKIILSAKEFDQLRDILQLAKPKSGTR